VRGGVQLRSFTPTRTPLEALFFLLTDEADHSEPDLQGVR
jgi:hypothetical protein